LLSEGSARTILENDRTHQLLGKTAIGNGGGRGSGKIGAALIDGLLERAQPVRALVRAGEPAVDPAEAVEVVVGPV